jgi:hypothetical protein
MILPDMESLVAELLAVLDEQIVLLDGKRLQMVELSRALVDRDDEATESLLEQIERAGTVQVSVDLRLKDVRERLGGALGCDASDVRLSRLAAELPEPHQQTLNARREKIVDLIEEFRAEYLQTTLLLLECSRVTSMLLDGILPAGERVLTYGATGADTWRPGAGLLNAER